MTGPVVGFSFESIRPHSRTSFSFPQHAGKKILSNIG